MVKRSVRSLIEKRVPISTKVLPSVRSMLMDAADAANRTLGAEIEYRLAQSFKAQDHDDLRQIIREEVRAAISTPGNGHCHTGLIPHWQHEELGQD